MQRAKLYYDIGTVPVLFVHLDPRWRLSLCMKEGTRFANITYHNSTRVSFFLPTYQDQETCSIKGQCTEKLPVIYLSMLLQNSKPNAQY